MTELPDRIRSAFDRVPGVSVEEAQESSRRRRSRRRGAVAFGGVTAAVVAALILVVFLPSGANSTRVKVRPAGSGPPPTGSPQTSPSPTPAALTASVELSEDTVPAGGKLSARVTVSNSSASAVSFTGCGAIFEVLLTAGSYQPGPAWPLCAQPLSIPAGQSTYTVPVEASYPGCGTPGLPTCTGSSPIPLPPGNYRARLYSQTSPVSLPPPASVQVLSSARACRAAQVSISVARQNPGNANQPSDYIGIKNITDQPCDIAGYPTVSTAQGSIGIRKQSSYEIRDPGTMSVQLQPGHSAYFGIGWLDSNPPCTRLHSLQVTLPSDTQPVDVPVMIRACAESGALPSLEVTAIAPSSAFTGGAPPP